MSDTTLKGCPIPGCGSRYTVHRHSDADEDRPDIIRCKQCGFETTEEFWQAIPRASAELGEIVGQMKSTAASWIKNRFALPKGAYRQSMVVKAGVLDRFADEIQSLAAPETSIAARNIAAEMGDSLKLAARARPPGHEYWVDKVREWKSWLEGYAAPETQQPGECNDRVVPQRCECGCLPRRANEGDNHYCGCGHLFEARKWGGLLAWFPAEAQPGESVAEVWLACSNLFYPTVHATKESAADGVKKIEHEKQDCNAHVAGPFPVHGAQPKQPCYGAECGDLMRATRRADELEGERDAIKAKLAESADDCDECEHAERYEAAHAAASLFSVAMEHQCILKELIRGHRAQLHRKLEGQEKRVGELEFAAKKIAALLRHEADRYQAGADQVKPVPAKWYNWANVLDPQPESTKQDDRGELPVCCVGCHARGFCKDWMHRCTRLDRWKAERTVCRGCKTLGAKCVDERGLFTCYCHRGVTADVWLKRNEVKDEDPEKMRERVRPTTGPAEQGDLPRVPGQDHKEVETVGEAGARGQQVAPALERARIEAEKAGRKNTSAGMQRHYLWCCVWTILEHLEGVDDRLYDLTKSNSQAWAVIGSMGERLDAADKRRCRYDPSASCGADESEGEKTEHNDSGCESRCTRCGGNGWNFHNDGPCDYCGGSGVDESEGE